MALIEVVLVLMACATTLVSAGGFNITEELKGYPDYSEFNNVLTKSGLASSINARNSLTVCVLTNSQMSSLKRKLGTDASVTTKVAALIRPLILLTFIDPTNPDTAKSVQGSQQVASLYQAVGAARTEEGIANLTTTKSGALQIVTVGGSNCTITKSVKLIAYNLSIVEVSNFLVPRGVLGDEPAPVSPPPVVAPIDSKKDPASPGNSKSQKSAAHMVKSSLFPAFLVFALGIFLVPFV